MIEIHRDEDSSLLSSSSFLVVHFSFVLQSVCSHCFAFLSANGRNVFRNRKRFCIALIFQIRLLKSPLTALIVTDFLLFLL